MSEYPIVNRKMIKAMRGKTFFVLSKCRYRSSDQWIICITKRELLSELIRLDIININVMYHKNSVYVLL